MKKFSFIAVSRNDNYGGDAKKRLENTINLLGDLIIESGHCEIFEIIIVDWGSFLPNLHKVLNINKKIKKLIKFIIVPFGIVNYYNRESCFSEVHAMNCGFRRMSGDFFIRIDQDTIVGERFIKYLIESDEIPSVAFSGRRDFDKDQDRSINYYKNIIKSEKSLEVPIIHYENAYNNLKKGNFSCFYGGAVGCLMVKRKAFEKVSGFNEELVFLNQMDVDLFNRLSVHYNIYNLGLKVDFDFYHQYHDRSDNLSRAPNSIAYRREVLPNNNPIDWGLNSEDLEVYQYDYK